ncbi:hypothetical protein H1S01_05560 [Heliobacterium chlorum]|uniref:Uncharacterized protein n=1 Tax=Heliobacterium chlorum TaxID=2698 RepID=A0ABR7SZL6_HELCL|nr:hypothetical protein [Heliobacterium chlorum]MBC9783977.1 hypothetical protein [Heliobacterium chlorum]
MAKQKKSMVPSEPEKESFLRKIPGFRTETPWKMGAALAFYMCIVFALLIGSGIFHNPQP